MEKMNGRISSQINFGVSVSIQNEIQRFESVHPSIYAMYDLIDEVIDEPSVQQQMRDYIVSIEDSFVNSQEWTLSRWVPELKLGIIGTDNSGKSSLVHRYLTGAYLPDESPEGGRFKKEIVLDGQSHLLLIRDEGGQPEMQFSQWVDAVIFTFSLDSEMSFNTLYSYYAKMSLYRNMHAVPIILVATQDSISDATPRLIDDARARKMAADLRCCAYYESCATYGLNVDKAFHEACWRIVKHSPSSLSSSVSGMSLSGGTLPHSLLTTPLPMHPLSPTASFPAHTLSRSHVMPGSAQLSHSRSMGQSGGSTNMFSDLPLSSLQIKNSSNSGNGALLRPSSSQISCRSRAGGGGVQQQQQFLQLPSGQANQLNNQLSLQGSQLSHQGSQLTHQGNQLTHQGNQLSAQGSNQGSEMSLQSSQLSIASNDSNLARGGDKWEERPKYKSKQIPPPLPPRDFDLSLPSPLSTPRLLRKLTTDTPGTNKPMSVQKSTSFNRQGLVRHPSQCSLQLDPRDLSMSGGGGEGDFPPVAVEFRRRKGKEIRSWGEKLVESFLREFHGSSSQKEKERSSFGPFVNKRHRSYSVQILEQSSDASRDFSTPNTTPTPSRKSRRHSNLFSKKDPDDKKLRNGESTKMGVGRIIPVKQGYLYKKSNKPLSREWQKKYITLLDDGRLTYHNNIHDYMENSHGKELKLGKTTVKVPGQRPRGSEIQQPSGALKQLNGSNRTNDSKRESGGSGEGVESVVIQNSSVAPVLPNDVEGSNGISLKGETPNIKKKHRRVKSSSRNIDLGPDVDGDGYEFVIVSLDNKQWHFEAQSAEEREEWVSAIQQQIMNCLLLNESSKSKSRSSSVSNSSVIQMIRSVDGNSACADCSTPNPEWASLNLGALICIECSGIHRNLGTHVSRVRSLELDDWPSELIKVMTSIGNTLANYVWEAGLKSDSSIQRPTPVSTREDRDRFIRAKYERHEFIPDLPYKDVSIVQQLIDAVARQDVKDTIIVLAHASQEIVNTPYSDTDTKTALHLAAAVGNIVLIQLLIWYGADIQQCDNEGLDAIHYAEQSGCKESLRLLKLITDSVHSITRTTPSPVVP